MEAYLDNAATTFVFPEVKETMIKVMEEDFGNPSSLHKKGMDAESYIKEAKDTICSYLKVEAKEIVFTSGGTESNNMALLGAAYANRRRGNHIITTSIEHASVYNPLIHLEEEGFHVTYLPVDEKGIVDIDAFKNALCEDTILVSIMMVNNEIGSVQPIEEIGTCIKAYKDSILFHVDAIQAYGKFKIYPKRWKIDLLSVSGHKIHGPKGSGFLYIKDKTKITPLLFGGGQQKGMRSGTENVPAIAGLSVATKQMYEKQEQHMVYMQGLKERLIQGVSEIEGVYNHSGDAPHIISLSFVGVRSEVLLHALEEKGVYVSSGSACSSNHPAISGTLKAIGVPKECLDSTLRFSISVFTTEEEIDWAVQCLKEIVPVLRRFIRR